MYCHRCGNGLPNDAVFCNICGTRVLLTDQDMPGPSPLGKVTVQFGDSSPMTPPQLSGSLPYPPTQFGDNSPITPPQFSGLQYPPRSSVIAHLSLVVVSNIRNILRAGPYQVCLYLNRQYRPRLKASSQ